MALTFETFLTTNKQTKANLPKINPSNKINFTIKQNENKQCVLKKFP